jgi:hypothetical protein
MHKRHMGNQRQNKEGGVEESRARWKKLKFEV